MKILDAIFLHACCEPLKPATALADRIVTYDMLARGILSIEMRATTAGIRPGQTVIVSLSSPIRDMIVSLAMLRLGAVAVSLDEPDSPAGKQLRANWVLVEDFDDVSNVTNAHLVTDEWFYGFTGPLATASPGYQFQDDEVCRIILSSGTTGVAKPLGFTPSILRDRIYTRIALNAECHAERTLLAPLMASQMGWVGALATLTTGGFCMFATTAETTLQMVDVYNVTNLVTTANQIRDLLEYKSRNPFTLNSLRALQIGGGHITGELIHRLQHDFCNRILCRYGSTETGIAAYASASFLFATPGGVGVVAPWAQIEAFGPNGESLPAGVEGELRVRTDSISQVWAPGRRFLSPDPMSWFYPGDIGRVDQEKVLYISGRVDNLINIGGQKVSPERVEQCLEKQPGVRRAAVTGLVGASGFDELWAVVEGAAELNVEALRALIKTNFPATPATRIIVAEIPRNIAGKTARRELHALCKRLALG